MANSSPKAKGKTPRKLTRRSPRTRILEELDAVKAMVAKHCITDARQPVKVVAPVELAPVLETMPLPKTVVEEKVMVPVPAKKVISCPGGPKAFNEFIQQYRAAHPGMNYQTALKQGGVEWKAKCGAAPTVKKNKTNKNKPKTLVATSSTANKPKAVRKTAVKKANKGFAAPVGFTQAAPLAKESAAYNPFNDFEATVPLPPPPPQKSNVAAVVTSANTNANGNKGKIGNWKVIRRNANTELNVLQNPKGEKVFKTAQNEVFGLEYDAKGNEVFGELIGLMRPDGTINTNVSPSNFEEA